MIPLEEVTYLHQRLKLRPRLHTSGISDSQSLSPIDGHYLTLS